MKRNNQGISLINIVLLVLIIICIFFIVFVVIGNKSPDVGNIDNELTEQKNVIRRNNTANQNSNEIDEKLDLNNNIGTSGGTTTNNNEANKYYYKQLSNVGKSLYNTLSNNIENLKNGTKKIEFETEEATAGDNIQSALDAFLLDRPDVFWIDILKISFATRTTTFLNNVSYNYYIEPQEGKANYLIDSLQTEQDVQNAINSVKTKINDIVNRAQGTNYDKIKFVHDELINLITYDKSLGTNSSNIYGALVENRCVCEGYAESFKIILDALNIPCVVVYGDGIDAEGNTEAHAWNYVKMDNGRWYAVDTTWDDPIIIGNGSASGIDRYKYFLKGSRNFIETHKPDGNVSGEGNTFEYPTLSEIDY